MINRSQIGHNEVMKTTSDSQVNVATLKARLAEFLRKVKAGGELTVLEHRLPIARIVPIRENGPLGATQPTADFQAKVRSLNIQPIKGVKVDSLAALLEERGQR